MRKPDLGRLIRKSRDEGALMSRLGPYVPGSVDPASFDATYLLGLIETHLTDDAELLAREWAWITVRSVRVAIAAKPGVLGPRCDAIEARLRAMDARAFGSLQSRLRSGDFGPEDLKDELSKRPLYEAEPFTLRLFGLHEEPDPENTREAEMVHYKASSLQAVVDLVGLLGDDDVLYDLGAGLGVVPILCAWLGAARTKGVEFEPAYCARGRHCISDFSIPNVEMIEGDARDCDYFDGTVFYFYDPFRGQILTDVLERLSAVAQAHPITLCARGRTTDRFDNVVWLRRDRLLPSGMVVYASQ